MITLNRNWVEIIKVNLPDYAKELGDNLEVALSNTHLDPVESHGCAFAAALAAGYPELSYEITLDDNMRGNDVREKIAKIVVDMTTLTLKDRYSLNGTMLEPSLYTLVAALVLGNTFRVKDLSDLLLDSGYTQDAIEAAITIASLVPALGKCII